jgi:hypothetical protein
MFKRESKDFYYLSIPEITIVKRTAEFATYTFGSYSIIGFFIGLG